jgi:hypothetical protein
VYDVRPEPFKQALDPIVADDVLDRIDRPSKLLDDQRLISLIPSLFEKLPLRPQGRPRDERDLMPPLCQTLAGNQGILLGPADDQTSDDVDDFYG